LRFERDMMKAGAIVKRIAEAELDALAQMRKGWDQVKQLPKG
jgi:hypothetical protein